MKVSDQICNDQSCWEMARAMDPKNTDDLFTTAWIKVKEKELNDKNFVVQHYKSFFYMTLKHTLLNEIKGTAKRKNREELFLSLHFNVGPSNTWEDELFILEKWLDKKPIDKNDRILKRTIKQYIKYGSASKAYKALNISQQTFLNRIKKAKIEIEYEYFKFIDRDPNVVVPMV